MTSDRRKILLWWHPQGSRSSNQQSPHPSLDESARRHSSDRWWIHQRVERQSTFQRDGDEAVPTHSLGLSRGCWPYTSRRWWYPLQSRHKYVWGSWKGEKNVPEGKVSDSCQGGNVHLVVVIDGLSLLGDQRAHSYGWKQREREYDGQAQRSRNRNRKRSNTSWSLRGSVDSSTVSGRGVSSCSLAWVS